MDVERGRTVKSWKPRRLGEREVCLVKFFIFLSAYYLLFFICLVSVCIYRRLGKREKFIS